MPHCSISAFSESEKITWLMYYASMVWDRNLILIQEPHFQNGQRRKCSRPTGRERKFLLINNRGWKWSLPVSWDTRLSAPSLHNAIAICFHSQMCWCYNYSSLHQSCDTQQVSWRGTDDDILSWDMDNLLVLCIMWPCHLCCCSG